MIQMNGTYIQTILIQPIALKDTSSIVRWCFPILVSGSTFLVHYCVFISIRCLTLSSKVKPNKICVTILHVQTHEGNIDVSFWIVVVSGSDVPISILSTVISGLIGASMMVVCDRCVATVDIPVFCTTFESCLEIW